MRDAGVSSILSSPSKRPQTPRQTWPEATSPYNRDRYFRNFHVSYRECAKRRARCGRRGSRRSDDTSDDTLPRAIGCRTAGPHQGGRGSSGIVHAGPAGWSRNGLMCEH
jgi:hypothetical protein